MKLNSKQFAELIEMLRATRSDPMGCDGCYQLMDQLAQAELDGRSLCDVLRPVMGHLEQCKCCRDEYDALMTALRAAHGRCE